MRFATINAKRRTVRELQEPRESERSASKTKFSSNGSVTAKRSRNAIDEPFAQEKLSQAQSSAVRGIARKKKRTFYKNLY